MTRRRGYFRIVSSGCKPFFFTTITRSTLEKRNHSHSRRLARRKNFEKRIVELVKQDDNHFNINIHDHDYLSIIKNKEIKYIELKVKKPYIESRPYKNATIYIQCNRTWNMEKIQKWGISLTVDKIIEIK